MVRKTAYTAALAMTLLVPGGTVLACEDAACATPADSSAKAKPLNIMQFMREQAASTRVGERRRHPSPKVAAKPQRAERAAVATRPARPASDAAASFASQNEPPVPVMARGEFNAIDGAALASASFPAAETVGASPSNEPGVQVVAAAEFNDIDRKAEEASPFPTIEVPIAAVPDKAETPPPPAPQVSWLQWLWSAVTGTLAALTAAVRQLVHV